MIVKGTRGPVSVARKRLRAPSAGPSNARKTLMLARMGVWGVGSGVWERRMALSTTEYTEYTERIFI